MIARQQPPTIQQNQQLLTPKGTPGDQLPESQRGLPHKIKQKPFSPGKQQDTFLWSQKMTKGDHNVKPRLQQSLLNNSTDDVLDDSGLNNFGYNTNKQEGISWSRESSTLSMAMNNSLVNDKNGPKDMRRKPTKDMAPESKTEKKFYGEKWSGDFKDFGGILDIPLERDTIKSQKNTDMKSLDLSPDEMVNMKKTTESKTLSQNVPQSSKPERITTMKEKEDFATEMVDKIDRRGTGVVFKRRESRSSNKKQSKSSTGTLDFCDFSDGEQDSTV